MNEDTVKLLCYVKCSDGTEYSTSDKEIVSIWISRDGAGPSGYYDVIYVSTAYEDVVAIPAHNCISWTVDSEANYLYEQRNEKNRIENLCLEKRALYSLLANGIKTVQDLKRLTERDILDIPNIGPKTAKEIIENLHSKRISLAGYLNQNAP